MTHDATRPNARRAGRWPRLFLAAAVGLTAADANALEPLTDFGHNPGELDAFVHIPAGAGSGLPVVIALHGCEQQAAGFDDETGLLPLANTTPFILLMPQQRRANNELNCFNWFSEADNRPGRGESASIRNMLVTVVDRHEADADRVYVMGLSAGGGMATALLANYPDRFAGGAVIAGAPYGCNRPQGLMAASWWWTNTVFGDAASATLACGLLGYATDDRSPEQWGDFVRDAADTTPQNWPPISLWQGSGDDVVDPTNLRELTEQWTSVHGIDAEPDSRQTLNGATRLTYRNGAGATLVEAWALDGFSHAVPIDTDAQPVACGTQQEYIRDANLCAVRRIAQFWGLLPGR